MERDLRLPPWKVVRIRSSYDINLIFREGKRINSRYFNLTYLKNPYEYSRFAIIAGKKYGKAHERNYIKRVFREILREERKGMVGGIDILAFPKKEIKEIGFHAIKEIFKNLIAKEGFTIGPAIP